MPFNNWHIGLIPQILLKMLSVLSKKGVYLTLVFIIFIFGLRGFWQSNTPFDRFAAISALIVFGYNAFLLFSYVSVFGKFDALRVASYWRYNMHMGAIVIAFAAYGSALAWHERVLRSPMVRRMSWLIIVLIILAPFVFAHKLRFDQTPTTLHFREVSAEVAALLSQDDWIFNADPLGSGESSAALAFELGNKANHAGFVSAFSPDRLAGLTNAVANTKISAIIVYSKVTGYEEALGLKLSKQFSYFLRRDNNDSWYLVKSWQKPKQVK